jgi:hypothetical protein
MRRHLLTFGLCLMTMMAMLTSCGSDVDQKSPRSVAEAALKYWDARDYEGLKTLVNPDNKNANYAVDNMIKMVNKAKENNPEYAPKPETVTRTFKEAKEEFTGKEITPETRSARVRFEAEKYPTTVVVEQKDGKWYFESFK